jgi:hypothetical protein
LRLTSLSRFKYVHDHKGHPYLLGSTSPSSITLLIQKVAGRVRRQAANETSTPSATATTKNPKKMSPFLRIQKNQGMIERGKVLGTINKVEERNDQTVENLTIVLPAPDVSEESSGLMAGGTDGGRNSRNGKRQTLRVNIATHIICPLMYTQ